MGVQKVLKTFTVLTSLFSYAFPALTYAADSPETAQDERDREDNASRHPLPPAEGVQLLPLDLKETEFMQDILPSQMASSPNLKFQDLRDHMLRITQQYEDLKHNQNRNDQVILRVQQENDRLSQEAKHYKEEAEKAETFNARIKALYQEGLNTIKQQSATIRDRDQANEQLRAQLIVMRSSAEKQMKKLEKYKKKLENKQAFIDQFKQTQGAKPAAAAELEPDLEQGQETAAEIQSLEKQLQELKTKNQILEQQTRTAHHSLQEAKESIGKLVQSNQELKTREKGKSKQIQDLHSHSQRQSAEIEELKKQCQQHQSALQKLNEEKAIFSSQQEQDKKALEAAQHASTDLKQQLETLTQQLAQSKKEEQALNLKVKEAQDQAAQCAQEKDQLSQNLIKTYQHKHALERNLQMLNAANYQWFAMYSADYQQSVLTQSQLPQENGHIAASVMDTQEHTQVSEIPDEWINLALDKIESYPSKRRLQQELHDQRAYTVLREQDLLEANNRADQAELKAQTIEEAFEKARGEVALLQAQVQQLKSQPEALQRTKDEMTLLKAENQQLKIQFRALRDQSLRN
jgi:chromosome segregation ATPase